MSLLLLLRRGARVNPLVGTAIGQSTGNGRLAVVRFTAALASGSGEASGRLARLLALAGTAGGQGNTAGSMGAVRALTAMAAAFAQTSARLAAIRGFQGTVAGLATTSPLKIHGPDSNLADSTLLELTANGELILAGGSGSGYRFAELGSANNPAGWAGTIKLKAPDGTALGYVLIYANP